MAWKLIRRILTAARVPAAFALLLCAALAALPAFPAQSPLPDLATLERELESIRGLQFLHPVEARPATPQMVAAYLSRELGSDTDMTQWETSLRDFGFVPPGFNVKSYFMRLMGQQVVAYYDPGTKAFYYKEGSGGNDSDSLDLGSLGMGGDFSVVDTTWLHELDHALQDQHFNLSRFENDPAFRRNQDAGDAADALIEGDATYVMMMPMLKGYGVDAGELAQLAPLMESLAAHVPDTANTPPIFSEGLVFPYVSGMRFVATLKQWGGWNVVNAAYSRLPLSTHQILHPEDFYLHYEIPADFSLPYEPGYAVAADNVIGELGTSILYTTYFPDETTDFSGWLGDRYKIYRRGGSDLILWVSEWNSDDAAAAFFQADRRILQRRFPGRPFRAISAGEVEQGDSAVNWIDLEGNKVFTLENVPAGELAKWKSIALAARSSK